MTAFPALVPKSRDFSPGDFAKVDFKARSGRVHRRQLSATPKRLPLNLTFSNVPDSYADAIFAHFRANMGTAFALDAGTMQEGLDPAVKDVLLPVATHEWRYEGHPRLDSLRPGYCTVSVNLIGFPLETVPEPPPPPPEEDIPGCPWGPSLNWPPGTDQNWDLSTALITSQAQYEGGLIVLTDGTDALGQGVITQGRMTADNTGNFSFNWEIRCQIRMIGGTINGGAFAIAVSKKTEGEPHPSYTDLDAITDATWATIAAVWRSTTNTIHLFDGSGELESGAITSTTLTNDGEYYWIYFGHNGTDLFAGISPDPDRDPTTEITATYDFVNNIGTLANNFSFHSTCPTNGPKNQLACADLYGIYIGGGS